MNVYHGSYTAIEDIDTFAKLADETTELCKKTWQEIYESLKQ